MLKIRTGFVSNSSSSSFLTVGIAGSGWYHHILDQMGIKVDPEAYGIYEEVEGAGFERWGYGSVVIKDDIVVFNAYTLSYNTIGRCVVLSGKYEEFTHKSP